MKHKILTEADLEFLFAGKGNKVRFPLWAIYSLLFISAFVIIFVVANFSSISQKIGYAFRSQDSASNTNDLPTISNFGDDPVLTGTLPELEENMIFIPKINVTAPITWNTPNIPEKVSSGLEKGTIHLVGTALPGEVGNVFITGHSSNYLWAKGNYKSIFALIPELVIGDQIYIRYINTTYIYKINSKNTVKADNLTVLRQGKDSTLTIMTCWPVGSSLYRMVEVADQIYPNPKFNSNQNNGSTPNTLPDIR
jgi:LPXTG-site transpeptidase (sortase) family protein